MDATSSSAPASGATAKWKEAVEAFRRIPRGTHHSLRLKQFDNCFVAEEAVTWYRLELHQKFEVDLTRLQTLQLLQKIYKAGVFVEVTSTQTSGKPPLIKERDFKDAWKLYRVVELNKDGASTGPASADPKLNPFIAPLTADEVQGLWELSFIQRFVKVAGHDVYTTFLKPGAVSGSQIMHNMTRISSDGIVMAPTPLDELPDWVSKGMHCIMTGVPSSEYPQLNYPGFQQDTYELIRDFFLNSFQAPLLSYDLLDAFLATFIRAALFNGDIPVPAPGPADTHIPPTSSVVQEKYEIGMSVSTEDLLLALLTPTRMKETVERSSNASSDAPTGSSDAGKPLEELTDQQLRISPRPPLPATGQRLFRSASASHLSDAFRDRSCVPPPPLPLPTADTVHQRVPPFLLQQYENSPNPCARKAMKMLAGSKMSGMGPEGKKYAVAAFRLLTLLQPPQSRRYLNILLQFMGNVSEGNLIFGVGETTRSIVVKQFSKTIFRCQAEEEYDEYLANKVVGFLMDNTSEVFDSTLEVELEQVVKRRTEEVTEGILEKGLSAAAPANKENMEPPNSRCRQVTMTEYEDQRLLGYTAPQLRRLLPELDGILNPKERLMQLTKFRENYPHIFQEKFGEGDEWKAPRSDVGGTGISEPMEASGRFLRSHYKD